METQLHLVSSPNLLFRRNWPLLLCGLIFVLSICFFVSGWTMTRDMNHVPYALFANYLKISSLMALLILILWLIGIYGLLFKRTNIASKLAIIAFVVAGTIFCGLGIVINLFETFRPFSSVQSVDHQYNIARRGGVGHDVGYYDLFECDLTGLQCESIHRIESPYELTPSQVNLQLDASTNTLSVRIDGEVVYTYPLP